VYDDGTSLDEHDPLAALLAAHYGVLDPRVWLLREMPNRVVCLISSPHTAFFVLRAFWDSDRSADLEAQAATLLFLEQQGFLAPRLLRTKDGGLYAKHEGWWLLATTFLDGPPTDYSMAQLEALGALLGRLHRLRIADAQAAIPGVPESRWANGGEAQVLLDRLDELAEQLPEQFNSYIAVFQETLREGFDGRSLPQALIHTDCQPGNAVWADNRTLALFDWDGTGIGPAILDLATLLISCDKGLTWEPRLQHSAERIAAVVTGYCRERHPNQAELEALPIAMRYAAALRGVTAFSAAQAGSAQAAITWRRWWARYEVATEAAAYAAAQVARIAQ